MKLLQRSVLRFPPAIQDRLDEVAELASGSLHCKVPRAAVVRAAVGDWLAASPHASHIAAVRNAHPRHGGAGAIYLILKRGR